MSATVLERFGTGLLTTEVLGNTDGGCTWARTAGPFAPAPFAALPGEVWATLTAAAVGAGERVSVALPDAVSDGVRRYRAPGPVSVAGALLDGALADPRQVSQLTAVMQGLGRCLHELHAVPVPGALTGAKAAGSRGLRRVGDWLEGRAISSIGLRSAVRVRGLLGQDRWDQLSAWHRAALGDAQRVLTHGAPGVGSVVRDNRFTSAVLLTGEDISIAPWYADLGWVWGRSQNSAPSAAGLTP